MRSEELLCRVTAGRFNPFEQTASAHNALQPDDVAGACHELPRDPFNMILYAYAGDHVRLEPLFVSLFKRAQRIASREGWRIPEGRDYLARMAALALYEATASQRCPDCNGTGVVSANRIEYHKCPACKARGRMRITEKMRAAFVGVDYSNWRTKARWSRRYQAVFQVAKGWADHGLGHLSDRI